MSWSRFFQTLCPFVAVLACSGVLAPEGYAFHCLGAAWALCVAVICVLPLARR